MLEYPPTAPMCADCHCRPGGEVKIKRAGVVVWQRVLCDLCFQTRRENTLKQAGMAMNVVVPA